METRDGGLKNEGTNTPAQREEEEETRRTRGRPDVVFAFVTFAREMSAKIDLEETRESQVICMRGGRGDTWGAKGGCQQQRQGWGAGPGWLEI